MTDTTATRRCTECGEPQSEARQAVEYPESGLNNVQLINVPVWVCSNGHEELEVPNVRRLHELLAHLIIRKPAPLTGDEIRFLRRRIGLQGKEFSERIGITPQALSRFENGRPVHHRTNLLIRLSAAALLASRDNKAMPSDLAPLVKKLEAWDIGSHRLRHVDAAPPDLEWESANL